MCRVSAGASFGPRYGLVALIVLLLVALATEPAEARRRRAAPPETTTTVSEPRYADIVVDANSGDVLHAVGADSQRHPASLTKVMTLYLLFERLEAGKLKLSTPLEVSGNAAAQAPSKLGLRPGQTINVEDAIRALVTKSANDVAVVVAETISGSETEFAKLMTRKARSLNMIRTVYKNASGLPDDDQITTARDQALLGMAIQDRFPSYYRYFATPRFSYRGHWMRNHNRLLGSVDGVDGIKTGYTRASGFNLITSVRRGKRHVVAVVFGGRTASLRDARMRQLIEAHVVDASIKRTAPKIAEREMAEPKKVQIASANMNVPSRGSVRTEISATAAIPAARPASGSTEPIKPNLVKTLAVKPGAVQTVAVAPLLLSSQPVTSQTHVAFASEAETESRAPAPRGAAPGILGVLPANAAEMPPPPAQIAASNPAPASIATASSPPARVHGGWIIQVGAFDDENEAKQRLSSVKDKAAQLLASADPFTEPVMKGDKKLYRARFAGLKQEQAEAACRQLKRSDIACMAIKN